MEPFNTISVEEETKIADITNQLYRRVQVETELILRDQLKKMGEDPDRFDECVKNYFPIGRKELATYEFNGVKILGIRVSDNRMAIEFDIPDRLTPIAMIEETRKGEVQNNV